jgi:hypothetical protein
MNNGEPRLMKSVLIVNMDAKDNHDEAGVGAKPRSRIVPAGIKSSVTYNV